jgi:hypothetical protein
MKLVQLTIYILNLKLTQKLRNLNQEDIKIQGTIFITLKIIKLSFKTILQTEVGLIILETHLIIDQVLSTFNNL